MNKQTHIYLIPTVLAPETEEKEINTRTKEVLAPLKYLFVENIRTARRYISALKLGMVIDDLVFFELDKNTTHAQLDNYFKRLGNNDAGILSEAGCPGIADPGAMAVEKAHRLNYKVVPVSGPSSLFLGLMASGFNGQSFAFHGYLPIDSKDRIRELKELEKTARDKKQTQLFIETPYRNQKLLADIIEQCHPETLLCVAANLTSPDEYTRTLPIKKWRQEKLPDIQKIPTVFLIY